MNRTRLLTSLAGLTVLAGAIALGAWPGATAPASVSERSVTVEVAPVDQVTTTRTVRLSGVTRATRRAALAFAVPARLATRPVEVGARVAAHQVIASLDDSEYRLAVSAARASLAEIEVRLSQAERDRARVERLAAARAATAEETEHVAATAGALEAARAAAAAQLEEAERLTRETRLLAPFSVTVTDVLLEPGEWASPGRPVVLLSGDTGIELEVELPEPIIGSVSLGQDVTVSLPFAGQRRVNGRVRAVARAAVGPGRLFPVVVVIEPAAGVVAGTSAELLLDVEASDQPAVPLRAVLNPGASRPCVFKLSDGRARRVDVELGRIHGDRVTVRGDLASGDRIVIAGHTSLVDGDRLEVRK